MLDWSTCPAVERTPDKVSGAWVFRGTRVPVRALFENLEDNASVDDFLEWFPNVSKQQVAEVLEFKASSHLPPVTQSLQGSLKNKSVDEKDYRKYLEDKYL